MPPFPLPPPPNHIPPSASAQELLHQRKHGGYELILSNDFSIRTGTELDIEGIPTTWNLIYGVCIESGTILALTARW